MAERRMFAKTIIDSDAFLDMPITARLLYYDLGMRADDEGFVNAPKKIMRMVGASEDDLRILAARKFIIPFESGIVVIKHWKIHNYIRGDRVVPTKYGEERELLDYDENGAYRLLPYDSQLTDKCQTYDRQLTDKRLTSDSQMSAQDRLGKDRLGKDRLGKDNNTASDEATRTKHKYGEYKHVLLTDDEYCRLNTDYGKDLLDESIKFLDEYIEEKGYKSKSHNLAIRRWVVTAVKEKTSKGKGGSPQSIVDMWANA